MQPRLERLSRLLGPRLFDSVLWGHEYDLSQIAVGLRRRLGSGAFRRIVFFGMGCSSVVSDALRGFLASAGVPLRVDVVNDHEVEWSIDPAVLADPATLVVIVCYSGWSVEPCAFYERMQRLNGADNLLVLSAGGRIAGMCARDGTSLVLYRLREADREYPLYHTQQFLAIFLDLFHATGLLARRYDAELADAVAFLHREFGAATEERARELARELRGASITLLATARWNGTLLKQATMFLNEIAMVPAHRHHLHEWSHTEVAAFSRPESKVAVVAFVDADDDAYAREKAGILARVLGDRSCAANRNIAFARIDLDQDGFLRKYFYAHFLMVHVAYHLGVAVDAPGRDLISIAASNPWWSQQAIERHPQATDVPTELSLTRD